MRLLAVLILAAALAAPAPVGAEGERAGAFDYYVLALSWSPSWCADDGADRNSAQCAAGQARRWVLHGLWPQFERGWPSWCRTDARNPSRQETARRARLFGSAGAAWYQWKKHGRCAGLTAAAYYELAEAAWTRIRRPAVLERVDHDLRVSPRVVEAAFLAANPDLSADGVTVICRNGRIAEVRICLTRALTPRPCTGSVARDCSADAAELPAPR